MIRDVGGGAKNEQGQLLSFGVRAGEDGQLRFDAGDPGESPPPQEQPAPAGFPLKEVSGRKVRRGEAQLAFEIMATFNRLAGTKYRAASFYRGIIGRIREHTELTSSDHVAIIRRRLDHPWWKGKPTPNVIYGNASVFERTLHENEQLGELDAYGGERR